MARSVLQPPDRDGTPAFTSFPPQSLLPLAAATASHSVIRFSHISVHIMCVCFDAVARSLPSIKLLAADVR